MIVAIEGCCSIIFINELYLQEPWTQCQKQNLAQIFSQHDSRVVNYDRKAFIISTTFRQLLITISVTRWLDYISLFGH